MFISEPATKKPKIMPTDGDMERQPQQCAHWVQRKKRLCKMTVSSGQKYCGEHMPAPITSEANDRDRIPCPLDSKHTVYKRNVQKHLKICNARQTEDNPPYIRKDTNSGEPSNATQCYSNLKLTELSDEEFFGIVEKVKKLHQKYVETIISSSKARSKFLDQELRREDLGPESRKHLIQAAALLGILDCENQLHNSTSFLEFGAGKGQLAFYLAELLQSKQLVNSQVILVDRMSLRHKKDNKIENRSLIKRIRADICDFDLNGLELASGTQRVVALSKHLCGGATDLTLRCITQSSPTPTEFVLIALCCHHRCDWSSFVGKEFFREQNITEREFAIMTKMASWAICGTGMSRERRRALEEQALSAQDICAANPTQRLRLAERENVGGMCKRVLDFARLEFLNGHGYNAELMYYVAREVTLENVCLIARKRLVKI